MRRVVACILGAARPTNKTHITLIAVAAVGVSSAAMARGGGGSGGGHPGHGGFGGHFGHHLSHFRHQFLRNQVWLDGWGWGWGWGGYGDSGYGRTTVVAFPQAAPQAANVTGSVAAGPCHWHDETFTVPSSGGGTRPITVVSCQ
jgi:hypothetical protein